MTDGIGPTDDAALPTRRVLAVGLVALALVAAGCLGGGGGGTTTEAAPETTEEQVETTEEVTTEAATTTEATTAGEMTTGTAGTTTGGGANTSLMVTVENASGAPLPNATVAISEEGGGVLEGIFGGDDAEDPGAVGPNGEVTAQVPAGNYTVEATAEGYIPGVANLSANGTDANITFTLEETVITPATDTQLGNGTPVTPPGNATVVDPGNRTPVGVETQYPLNITVEDASGAPVPNATVQVADEGGPLSSVFGDGQGAGSVNSQGAVSVEVGNGTYTVEASAEGFADGQQDVEVNGSAANATVTLNRTTTSG